MGTLSKRKGGEQGRDGKEGGEGYGAIQKGEEEKDGERKGLELETSIRMTLAQKDVKCWGKRRESRNKERECAEKRGERKKSTRKTWEKKGGSSAGYGEAI